MPSTTVCPELLFACCPSVSLYEALAAMSSEQLSAYAVSLRAMGLGALAQQWHGTLVLSLPLQIWTPNVQTFQLSVLTGKCATSDLNYCLPFVFLSVTTIVCLSQQLVIIAVCPSQLLSSCPNFCLHVSTTVRLSSQLLLACLNYRQTLFGLTVTSCMTIHRW